MLDTTTDSASVRAAGAGVPSPPASRLERPRWLDPRLVAGLLLVLGSVVVGARVVAAADDTTPVLVATSDLAPGQPLTGSMVETRDVVLDGNLELYYTGAVGAGYVVVRPVDEGELLARSAVAPSTDTGAIRYVTVAVPATEVPSGLAPGDVVDVWRTPAEQDEVRTAEQLIAAVTVVTDDTGGGGLAGPGNQARVTLAVTGDADADEPMAELVAAARDGLLYLVRVPDPPR